MYLSQLTSGFQLAFQLKIHKYFKEQRNTTSVVVDDMLNKRVLFLA